jgi:predicted DNA-binding transcriptional regulator AlpA
MSPPVVVPSLDALVVDPAKVAELLPEVAADLLVRVIGLQTALATRALGARSNGTQAPPEAEHYLAPEEAAALLGVTRRWLYRNAKRLPFARPLSRKVLRFSEPGLRQWQAQKRR